MVKKIAIICIFVIIILFTVSLGSFFESPEER